MPSLRMRSLRTHPRGSTRLDDPSCRSEAHRGLSIKARAALTHPPRLAMPVRKLHALAAIPCSLVLDAARRRDALLRGRTIGRTFGRTIGNDAGRFGGRSRLPSLAILSAVAGLSSASLSTGCVAVGGSRKCEPPTLGKQLIDLKAARDAGAITEAEYDAAKSRMLAGEKSGDMTCGKPGEK